MFTTNLSGGTCSRCHAAIQDVYRFRAGDGREFKLGVECVAIVFPRSFASGQLARAKKQLAKKKRDTKLERDRAKVEELLASGVLDTLPHPYNNPKRPRTLGDYARAANTPTAIARILKFAKEAR